MIRRQYWRVERLKFWHDNTRIHKTELRIFQEKSKIRNAFLQLHHQNILLTLKIHFIIPLKHRSELNKLQIPKYKIPIISIMKMLMYAYS